MIRHIIPVLLLSSLIFSQEITQKILIESNEESTTPLNSYSTYKVEKVAPTKLKDPNRQSIADVVKDQVGVEAQTYCSNCGAKRLTINGLKGEHTSILIDGIPLHSAVSSFYGVDSIPVNGIEEIEVMRGTGASLTNPESIGGSLDLITVNPLEKIQNYSTSINTNSSFNLSAQNYSALASIPLSKDFGISVGAQFTKQETWDEDENGVTESPERRNFSALFKSRYLPNKKNDLSLRLGISNLRVLGGATNPKKPNSIRPTPAGQSDFNNGSVEEKFTGAPSKITDWISLKRYEGAIHWTNYLSQSMTLNWNSGFARQEQAAIYQHGFDYAHNDNIFVSDLGIEYLINDKNILKAGAFYKSQWLRSASAKLFDQLSIPKDNFDHQSIAAYAKYSFLPSESFEMDFALRLDHLIINWRELTNEVEEFIPAPRFQLRHEITDHLSQRLSYGLGYRAPLTFFESQHGNNENGYKVDISELEKAHSLVYSLSYNTPKFYITAGAHYTRLLNMAYGFESLGNPILYKNTNQNFDIWANDLLLGYKLKEGWMLEGSLEFFKYQDRYTLKLPTAAIEKRFQLKTDFNKGPWNVKLSAILVPSRDISRYGRYRDHYVDRKQFPSPEVRGLKQKDQKAPAFLTIDTSISYLFKKTYTATLGVTNLLDVTQISKGDGPSAWHWHFDHAHYDGLHTWGPNRGREIFLKLSAEL